MPRLAYYLRHFVLSLLLVIISGAFLTSGADVAKGRVTGTGGGCDASGGGPDACLQIVNIFGFSATGSLDANGVCLPRFIIKGSEPTGYPGQFCEATGVTTWQITPYPTNDQYHPPSGQNNSSWTAGSLSTPACNDVGQYNPNPDSSSTWSNYLPSQTFTFQFDNPAPAQDQSGWLCSNPTNCSCTVNSWWLFGAYNGSCNPYKVDIYEQSCYDQNGSRNACPSSSSNSKIYNCVKGDCTNETTIDNGDGTTTTTCDNNNYDYTWTRCDIGSTISCNTPKGMVEDDKPWCALTYSPDIGQWTNGCVAGTVHGIDVAEPDRRSGLAGGGGGGNRCTNGGIASGSMTDNAGNVGTCPAGYVSWIDKTDPAMTTLDVPPFAAEQSWTPTSLNFVDTCGNNGEGPCSGTSGVGAITATITGPSGQQVSLSTNGGGEESYSWSFSEDFSRAGPYQLELEVCDMAVNGGNAGNCVDYNLPDFYHVVANVPEWENCTKNYHNVCPSSINYGASSARYATSYTTGNNAADSITVVADNADNEYHAVEVQLSDRYGNPVVSEAGIKTVQTQYNWINTVYADQIMEAGDAIHYTTIYGAAGGADEEYLASEAGALRTQVGPLTELNSAYPYAAPGDGHYTVQTRAHAPTATGYAPLQEAPHGGWQVMLQDMIYTVSSAGYPNVGAASATMDTSATAAAPAPDLKFAPTLVAVPEAMNPDGAGGYAASIAARQNVTINEEKRFQLAFTNNSVSNSTTTHEIGLVLDATDANVTWRDGVLETITTNGIENPTPAPADLILSLDTTQSSFSPGWNNFTDIATILANAINNPLARFRATPVLAYETTAPSTDTEFRAYLGYTVSGVHVRHKSERIGTDNILCGNGTIDPNESCGSCPQDYTTAGIACCGNNIVETGEECDPPGGTCDTSCQVSTGGDLTVGGGNFAIICTDGLDNDGNGLIDCADSDCAVTAVCDGSLCGNGVVNLNEDCETCPQDIAVCGLVQNATIDIAGIVRTADGTVTNNPFNELNQDVGDISRTEIKNAVNRAVAAFTADTTAARCDSNGNNGYTITGSGTGEMGHLFAGAGPNENAGNNPNDNASKLQGCGSQNGALMFFDFAGNNKVGKVKLELGGSSPLLPTGPHTILIRGGDLHIKSNLVYPSGSDNSLGIIVLADENGNGGNVYVYPEVTNVVGALYAEGSVISVNSAGNPDEYVNWDNDSQCSADGSEGICDRSTDLRNQLYWQGLLISQNTIGGSDKNFPECPAAIQSICDGLLAVDLLAVQALPATHAERVVYDNDIERWTAKRAAAIDRRYDFLYMRKFTVSAGGVRATEPAPPGGNVNNNSLIIEYDGRIISNPPPLFDLLGVGSSGELGR